MKSPAIRMFDSSVQVPLPDQPTCFNVPEFDGSVVAACDDELVVELETGHSGLMFVWTGESLETLARQDVPDLDCGVSITRD